MQNKNTEDKIPFESFGNSMKSNKTNEIGDISQVFDSMIQDGQNKTEKKEGLLIENEEMKQSLNRLKESLRDIKERESETTNREARNTGPKKAIVFPNEIQVSIAPMVTRQGRRSRYEYDRKSLRRVESPAMEKIIIIGENSTSRSRKGGDLRSTGSLSRKVNAEIKRITESQNKNEERNIEDNEGDKEEERREYDDTMERIRKHHPLFGFKNTTIPESSRGFIQNLQTQRKVNFRPERESEDLPVRNNLRVDTGFRRSSQPAGIKAVQHTIQLSPGTGANSVTQRSSVKTISVTKKQQHMSPKPPIPTARVTAPVRISSERTSNSIGPKIREIQRVPQNIQNQTRELRHVQRQIQHQITQKVIQVPSQPTRQVQVPIQKKTHQVQIPIQAQPPQFIMSNPSSTHSSPHPVRVSQPPQQIVLPPQNQIQQHPPHIIPLPQQQIDFLTRSHFQQIYHGLIQQNAGLQQQLQQLDAKYNSIANRLIGEVNTNKIKLKNEEIERRIQTQNIERQRSVEQVKRLKDKHNEEARDRKIDDLERQIKGLESQLKVKSEINKVIKMRGLQAEGNSQDLVDENIKLKAQIQSLKIDKNDTVLKFQKEKEHLINAVIMLKKQLGQQLTNNNELRDKMLTENKGRQKELTFHEEEEEIDIEDFKNLQEQLSLKEEENDLLITQIEELKEVIETMTKVPEENQNEEQQRNKEILSEKLEELENLKGENEELKNLIEISESKWNSEINKALASQREELEQYYRKLIEQTKEDLFANKEENRVEKSLLANEVKKLMHSNARLEETNQQLAQEVEAVTSGSYPQLINPETQILRIENEKLKMYTRKLETELKMAKEANMEDENDQIHQYSQRVKISEEQSRNLLLRVSQLETELLETKKLKEILREKEFEIEELKEKVNVST